MWPINLLQVINSVLWNFFTLISFSSIWLFLIRFLLFDYYYDYDCNYHSNYNYWHNDCNYYCDQVCILFNLIIFWRWRRIVWICIIFCIIFDWFYNWNYLVVRINTCIVSKWLNEWIRILYNLSAWYAFSVL